MMVMYVCRMGLDVNLERNVILCAPKDTLWPLPVQRRRRLVAPPKATSSIGCGRLLVRSGAFAVVRLTKANSLSLSWIS